MSCPCSPHEIDERVAQARGLIASAALLLFIYTPLKWVALLLALEFLLVGFGGRPGISPADRLLARVFRLLPGKPRRTNAGPKLFAARVGFLLTLMASATWYLGTLLDASALRVLSIASADLLLACTLLEGVVGFCVGCWIFGHLPEPLRQRAMAPVARR